jgi:tRNA(fMet)-specific endonuclease VapC
MESPTAEAWPQGRSTMSFLLDTDTCSAHFKGNPQVTNRLLQYTGRLHISVITLGELYTWVLRARASPKRLQGLLTFLNDVQVLDITANEARRFGEIRAGLLDQGQSAPEMDLLIAATALVNGLTVVTHNTIDYANVPGLSLIDWLGP